MKGKSHAQSGHVANQQGCKHVERVTSYVAEECASEGGEESTVEGVDGGGGLRSSPGVVFSGSE